MQLKLDALAAHLAKPPKGELAAVYVISGDEPLLAIEAQDAIRTAARAAGFTERDVLHTDHRFDWSLLSGAAGGMSLFAEKKVLEIRLPSGKPGKDGAQALIDHAQHATEGVLTMIALPKLDKRAREADWAAALDRAGVWIDVPKIERAQLPAWIGARLQRQNQRAPREALDFIADRVEGNLLAAQQEISKLGLLYPAGELSMQKIADAVLDVARYDVFALPAAMLSGDGTRALRMLDGLRAEGEALPLLLWTISEEVRTLLRVKAAIERGTPFAVAARENRVWGPREQTVQTALRRVNAAQLTRLLQRCADIDRLAKGLRAERCDSDAWLELGELVLEIASGKSAALIASV